MLINYKGLPTQKCEEPVFLTSKQRRYVLEERMDIKNILTIKDLETSSYSKGEFFKKRSFLYIESTINSTNCCHGHSFFNEKSLDED
jgi:hypothetical protein